MNKTRIVDKVFLDEVNGIRTYLSVTLQRNDDEPFTIKLGDLVQGRNHVHYDSYSYRTESSNIFSVDEIYTTANGNIMFKGKDGSEGKDDVVLL